MGNVKTRAEVKAELRRWLFDTSRTEKVKRPVSDVQDLRAWWYLNFGIKMTEQFLVKALYINSAIKAR